MSTEESKSDLVKEALEHVANGIPVCGICERLLCSLCSEVEELRRRNETQEESIIHLQSQLRVMKDAIEAAVTYIKADPVLDDDGLAALAQLRSAIIPKGESD